LRVNVVTIEKYVFIENKKEKEEKSIIFDF